MPRPLSLAISLALVAGAAAAPLDAAARGRPPGERTEDLQVVSRGEVTLAGTLFLPAGAGPFPAVVFTHGAEPGSRSHRGYRAWAQRFQDRGIAGLVFDKRGVGDSEGTYVEAPDLEIPAADVVAWVKLLARRRDISADRIGVLGWSQGGWVGPLAASKDGGPSFVVSLSGPGVSPLEQNIFDKTNQFAAGTARAARVEQFSRVLRLVWTYLVTGEDREAAQAAWDAVADETWFQRGYNGPPMMDRDTILRDPRMQHYVAHSSYDPVPVLERIEVPMLAIFGGADRIVPVEASVEAMVDAFSRNERGSLTYRVFPRADHGLQVTSPTGRREPAAGLHAFVLDWVIEVTEAGRLP